MEEIITQNLTWTPIRQEHKLAFSVDCILFGYDNHSLKVLLTECTMPQYRGKWSLIGDLVRTDEDLIKAALRVIERYTNIQDIYIEQVHTFGKVGRHPLGRVITTAFYSLMKIDDYQSIYEPHIPNIKWAEVKDLTGLAFDHDEILQKCLEKLRRSVRESPIGFNLLPRKFTLTQLQTLYEVVLEIQIDKRNFRRKLRKLDLLRDTNVYQEEVSHRPAKLYRFDYEKYQKQRLSGFHFEI